ncbi:D-alanyl-D-alanine carboxypeptidase/D-alanyl-D-alanine endopeptidase [Nocardioides sp.]|uniref:D-alanyl-D-alanine carboxypeptidase/D-alanyl-D-alanine endopeptidase n=1 Tax=Nocardioides sp. TaxID=35761 RepID=UPI002B72BABE|nr:D-alanyl-D-alanine carboxypeptidase/D-alanyl-D-alanine-endopeptidase [Nocardioides sp.]HXH79628.1 D-alanyl-D-alanine carboxypeptidase/D-alanyl-D-alanine-endopeptidase [Nocardioides sp.]
MGRDRRHPAGPGPWAHWLPTLLVLALVAAAFAAHRFEWGPRYLGWSDDDPTSDPAAVAPPAGLELPAWSPPPPVATATAPAATSAAAVEAVLAKGLRNKTLGKHVVAAVGDLGGDGAVWTHQDDQFLPASTTKLLTSVAALAALGPDARFTTRVVRGAGPREIVLVGGGDPYLSSKPLTPEERAATYPARSDVVTLARAVAGGLTGRKPVSVAYDDSLFSGPTNNPMWRADYVPDDIVSPITALWVDRGASPTGFGRSDDPSLTAAATFASALAKTGVKVVGTPTRVVAAPGAVELASVESAPVSQIVERVLDVSDNEAAEVLAHHVGLAVSGDGSFTGGAAGVISTLQALGVETGTDVVHDGSGLSRLNRLSPGTLVQVLQVAARPERPELRTLITGLPVAGFTGSLTNRFSAAGVDALGDVRAKTGTLSGVSSLAGVVAGRDGTDMVFVLAVDKTGKALESEVEAALDRLAADLAACRCGSG